MTKETPLWAQLKSKIDPDLLITALTHRSFVNENSGSISNERLEFLGDSVLGFTITSHLYREFPANEGVLSQMKATLVSGAMLAKIANEHEIGQYILLGKGEHTHNGANKESILADTMESLFGAYYLSAGIAAASDLILEFYRGKIESIQQNLDTTNWMQVTEAFANQLNLQLPEAEFAESGNDDSKIYRASYEIPGIGKLETQASSKKKARIQLYRETYEEMMKLGSPPVSNPHI
jgi:ribonuclease-3